MNNVPMYREARNLKEALTPYKNKLASYWKVVREFEALDINQDELRTGRYRITKKSEFEWGFFGYGYNQYGTRKVLKVTQRHSGFKAKLVDWEIEEYQGARNRWTYGTGGVNAAWDTVWLHFETTTDIGLPFHTPLRLAVQNGKLASVWQDQLLEYGLVENTDFKYNNLGDMLILSDIAKDAIEYVTPPKPMVIQFSAQVPVNELLGEITGYWDKVGYGKNVHQELFPRFRSESCSIGIELV